MNPYYQDKWVKIYHGDCLDILLSLDSASAIVTDPPYELGFMGKSWDSKGISFQPEIWEIVRKVCLPGAPLLSFGGTRTFHRIACAIEDAGWEIRDTLMWVYGSGFPKSLDISKAIDADACREELEQDLGRKPTKEEFKARWEHFREIVGKKNPNVISEKWREREGRDDRLSNAFLDITLASSPEAQLWQGYGSALKPAYEPIILAMNPLDGTFANNALKHGVAGLNIDECRIGYKDKSDWDNTFRPSKNIDRNCWLRDKNRLARREVITQKGRFPANFIHDGSQMVMELFPETKSSPFISKTTKGRRISTFNQDEFDYSGRGYVDNGSAARFFYCAKASKAERNKGCEGLDTKPFVRQMSEKLTLERTDELTSHKNNHPTVKPLALMEYLCKLVKMPEHNLIIDPFCGSGSTLLACIALGIPCIGIDSDENSCEIAAKRCSQDVMELNA